MPSGSHPDYHPEATAGPNAVVVVCDQLRASALGCYGNDAVETPAIDQFAGRGLRFESAHSSSPLCTPARGSLLTGLYPHAHRALANWSPLSPATTTLGEAFRGAGYRTGYVGKWHLDGETGYEGTLSLENKRDPGFVPPERRRGFEHWRGFNDSHDHHRGQPRFDRSGACRWESGYQPTVQTGDALEFVRQARADPFLVVLSWGPPHPPFEAPEAFDRHDPEDLDLPPNVPEEIRPEVRENLAAYYGMVESVDAEFDRLLRGMEQAGVREDTHVVFTADHGEYMGAHGNVRGKGTPYRESTHVPLVLGGPGVQAGESAAVVSLVDYLPTLCSLCDVPAPEVHGRDLVPHLRGEASGPEAAYLQGELTGRGWRAVRTRDALYAVDRGLEPLYRFDTDADPYEQENLATPEDRDGEMHERLVEFAYDCGDRQVMARAFRRGSPFE